MVCLGDEMYKFLIVWVRAFMSVGECLWSTYPVLSFYTNSCFCFQTDSVGPELSVSRDNEDKIFYSVFNSVNAYSERTINI